MEHTYGDGYGTGSRWVELWMVMGFGQGSRETARALQMLGRSEESISASCVWILVLNSILLDHDQHLLEGTTINQHGQWNTPA